MRRDDVLRVLDDPLAKELMAAPIPARLAYVRDRSKQMARIDIEPEWAKLLDFETRLEELVRARTTRAS